MKLYFVNDNNNNNNNNNNMMMKIMIIFFTVIGFPTGGSGRKETAIYKSRNNTQTIKKSA
jgi:hypothetical protein